MPHPGDSNLNEFAVLYAWASDSKFGEPQVSAGVQIAAKWELENSQSLDPKNTMIKTAGVVFVSQELTINSLLWRGKLKNIPSPVTDLYLVIDYNQVSDIKGRKTPTRWVTVQKYADSLPTIV